jgi:uncharacterized protein
MIIDFHTHIFSPDVVRNREKYVNLDPLFAQLYANPKAALATADDLIGVMNAQGIGISVVQNIAWSDAGLCRASNDYIMESTVRFPQRLIGFGMVALDSEDSALAEVERCTRGGLRGIGEVRPELRLLQDLDLIRPVIESVIKHGLILLTHSSEPVGHSYAGKGEITPRYLYPLINAFPDLKLVCAHWGGGLPFYTLMPEVKKAMNQVYFDSAASPYLYSAGIYGQVAILAGEDRILFGSDYPLLQPRRLLAQIEELALPPETKHKLLGNNAARLLGI